MKTILAVLALLLTAAPAYAGDGIGVLQELTGTVRVTHVAAGQTAAQEMKPQDPVFMDDVIETDQGARAIFTFADGAELVITGQGKFTVDEYAYDAEKGTGKAILDLIGLAFSYAGGKMDKNDDVTLNMNYGSIGIRGTKIFGVLRNGLNWVYLEEGAAQVSNKGGETTLAPGFGTRISAKEEMPAPAYQWGEAEIAWLKRLVDDPSSHETPLMASNMNDARGGGAPSGGAVNEAGMPAEADELGSAKEAEMRPAAPAARARSEAGPAAAAPPALDSLEMGKEKAAPPSKTLLFREKIPPSMLGTKLAQDPSGALRVDARHYAWVSLAAVDISEHAQEGKTLVFTVDIKALDLPKGVTLRDRVYLQMLVDFREPGEPGKPGKSFQRHVLLHPYDAPEKPGEWQSFSSSYTFGEGTTDFRANLNIVIKDQASLLVRNVKLEVK